jgi:hypothetical protein
LADLLRAATARSPAVHAVASLSIAVAMELSTTPLFTTVFDFAMLVPSFGLD